MISCIICSRNVDLSTELKENIASTIGCDFELIVIDNSKNKYSIFSAYNEGVRRAKGELLCFMHEDIIYQSSSWGLIVQEKFKCDDKVGLVGVLGTHFIPKCICNIGDSGVLSSYYITDKKQLSNKSEYFCEGYAEVVAVDGMWFCVRKDLFNSTIRFDETFNGFHLYDMDICLQIRLYGYKCYVVNKILIEHYSAGGIDSMFLKNSIHFYEKWKEYLPQLAGVELSHKEKELSASLAEMNAYARELKYYLDKRNNFWFFRLKRKIRCIVNSRKLKLC